VKAEIVCMTSAAPRCVVQQWIDAVRCDRDNGLLPSWIGAVVLTVHDDMCAHMTFISKERWQSLRLFQMASVN
jgi:hypothetical protein